MKIVLLCAGAAVGSLLAHQAAAAGSASLWPTKEDKAICDPIFSRLAIAERGTQLAQAMLPKPAIALRPSGTSQPKDLDVTACSTGPAAKNSQR